ncbi:MAG: type IIL restriction-modification enzyme MmeI [Erythrobacter sp.]|nr:type IIL restriction-modification enzyme MmeI [Erythrobacter sp.]MDZ4274450.1 type IIL restriction-modification enzyme MmeI [Erythrobacter sp.]
MSYARAELMDELSGMSRYIVCGQVTKRPIFEFVSPTISPNAALTVFTHEDDYTFGVLQSTIHWKWFDARCSTIKSDPRYTSNTVFDSFPWPQAPTLKQVQSVAAAAVELRKLRRELCSEHSLTMRELYRSIELPGEHPLKTATAKLDQAVGAVYGMKANDDVLAFLLALNHKLAHEEAAGNAIQGPGLPPQFSDSPGLVSGDCLKP